MNISNGMYSPTIAGGIVVPPKTESAASPQDIAGGIVVPPKAQGDLDSPEIAGGIVVPPSQSVTELADDVVSLSR